MSEKTVIRTERAPAPFQGAPYSQAICFGELVFVSGQLPVDPETGKVVDGDIGPQTEQVFSNVAAILEEAGSSLDRLLKTSVFLADLGDFDAMNEVYGRFAGERPPARSTFEVAGLPAGARLEVEVVAHR